MWKSFSKDRGAGETEVNKKDTYRKLLRERIVRVRTKTANYTDKLFDTRTVIR